MKWDLSFNRPQLGNEVYCEQGWIRGETLCLMMVLLEQPLTTELTQTQL